MRVTTTDSLESFVEGTHLYVDEDYSIEFQVLRDTAFVQAADASVLINDVEIMTTLDGIAVYVHGLVVHPGRWIQTNVTPSRIVRSQIRFSGGFMSGLSIRLTKPAEWSVYINVDKSWLCMGILGIEDKDKIIEFASGAVAVIREENLVALWVHLSNLPQRRWGRISAPRFLRSKE